LLELLEEIGVPFVDERVTLDELVASDEVFLLGTTIEVLPVVTVDGRPVADGRPGPLTARLRDAYRSAVSRWLAPAPQPV